MQGRGLGAANGPHVVISLTNVWPKSQESQSDQETRLTLVRGGVASIKCFIHKPLASSLAISVSLVGEAEQPFSTERVPPPSGRRTEALRDNLLFGMW